MIVDLTDRFHVGKYQREDINWSLNRNVDPVEAIIIHHTAGWYGGLRAIETTPALEMAQLDALAADHRNRFGIGPGYHYAVFPSGRVYAIGKSGTHRAHTKGRNPMNKARWNRRAIGIVAFGDYEKNKPTAAMVRGIREAVADIKRWSRARDTGLPVYWHRDVPTVTHDGTVYTQATACCGQYLIEALIAAQDFLPVPEPEPEETWIGNLRDGVEALEKELLDLRGKLYSMVLEIRSLSDLIPDEDE